MFSLTLWKWNLSIFSIFSAFSAMVFCGGICFFLSRCNRKPPYSSSTKRCRCQLFFAIYVAQRLQVGCAGSHKQTQKLPNTSPTQKHNHKNQQNSNHPQQNRNDNFSRIPTEQHRGSSAGLAMRCCGVRGRSRYRSRQWISI